MSTNKDKAIQTTYWSIFGNLFLAIIKAIAGVVGHSYALVADAIESTTDVFSSLLVLFGLRYSTRPADDNHPYGHGKAEPLITFMVVGFLLVSAGIIAHESINNTRTPHQLPAKFTLIVLGVIILIKEGFYRFVSHRSKQTKSTSLKADAWHHRSDAITSLMSFVGISIALILGPGYEAADDWAAFLASVVIVFNAYLIFRPALSEIMDEHIHDDVILEVNEIAKNVNGVKMIEKCLVRKAGLFYLIDLHMKVDGQLSVTEGHEIAHLLKSAIQQAIPEVHDVLIHTEPL